MSVQLDPPLRDITAVHVDGRGVAMLALSCGHVTASIGRPSSAPDRRRCETCAPVKRGIATNFVDTGSGADQAFRSSGDAGGCLALEVVR